MRPHKNRHRHTRKASGSVTGSSVYITGAQRKLFGDVYHTLLTISWPVFILGMSTLFLLVNAFFGMLYMFDPGCIENARPGSFTDLFFFSVHTLTTIGYGHMFPKTFYANVLVAFEAFAGLFSVALSTGLMFAKFSVPSARVLFSRNAVITQRDGRRALTFRVANERANAVMEAQINVVLIFNDITVEGEKMRRLIDLTVDRRQTPVFALTWSVTHYLDGDSPLAGYTSKKMSEKNIAIIVSLIGIDGTSGQTIHARHSYAHHELKWNTRLVDLFTGDGRGNQVIDYSKFHDVEPILPLNPIFLREEA